MNREILFKAKRIDNGEWVEGYIGKHTIMPVAEPSKMPYLGTVIEEIPTGIFLQECYEVVPSTICQYTGFRDVEGVKAFENDIVFYEKPRKTGKIVFAGGQFRIEWKDDDCLNKNVEFWFTQRRIHVIGNVFDEEEDER